MQIFLYGSCQHHQLLRKRPDSPYLISFISESWSDRAQMSEQTNLQTRLPKYSKNNGGVTCERIYVSLGGLFSAIANNKFYFKLNYKFRKFFARNQQGLFEAGIEENNILNICICVKRTILEAIQFVVWFIVRVRQEGRLQIKPEVHNVMVLRVAL